MDAMDPTVPSSAAVRRLQDGLEQHINALHGEIETDLDDVALAMAADQQELALQVLAAHIRRLDSFAHDLRQVVAGAVVEREAETVINRSPRADRPARIR